MTPERREPIEDARGKRTRARLERALGRLSASSGSPSRLTVTALCEGAGISRNTLYRYHAPVLAALRAARPPKSARRRAQRAVVRRREEAAQLRTRVAGLAALAEHYFNAWRESAALLARRERELAALRKHPALRLRLVPPRGDSPRPR